MIYVEGFHILNSFFPFR